MIEESGLLSLAKAAQLLKTTQVNILMHARKGLLEQIEKDGFWFITISSLENYVSNHGIRKSDAICVPSCSRHASCGGSCG